MTTYKNKLLKDSNMVDEKLLIERMELLKEKLSEKMGNHRYLNRELTIKLFDSLIKEIKIMGEQKDG